MLFERKSKLTIEEVTKRQLDQEKIHTLYLQGKIDRETCFKRLDKVTTILDIRELYIEITSAK